LMTQMTRSRSISRWADLERVVLGPKSGKMGSATFYKYKIYFNGKYRLNTNFHARAVTILQIFVHRPFVNDTTPSIKAAMATIYRLIDRKHLRRLHYIGYYTYKQL
jgi:hypothetical protein